MANTNLNCSASSCAYNNLGECFAGGINVDGRHATTTSHTFCASYVDKANAGFTNVSDKSKSVGTNDIICQALECKYNENKDCHANHVHINAGNVSCETFEK